MKQALAAGFVLLLVIGGIFYVQQRRAEQTPTQTIATPDKLAPATPEPDPVVPATAPVSAPATAQEPMAQPIDPATSMRETVKAHTAFATDLYRVLLKDNSGQNEFFSPYSIAAILSLTSAGARGRTADELNKLLHISNVTTISAGTAKLTHDLVDNERGSRPYQLSVANSLWNSSIYPMLPSFTALAAKYYDTAGIYFVDFRANPEAARTKINQWVEDQTMSRIKELLPRDAITPITALVLANAVYFKGGWERPFDTRLTRDDTFHVSATVDVPVSLMRTGGTWQYFEDDDVQVVSLPFATSRAGAPPSIVPSMLVVVPRATDGLADLEKKLTPELIGQWIAGLQERYGQVFLPRFTMTRANDLKNPLKALGLVEAFDQAKADFRAMATPPPGDNIYISGVYHKAFVDVNEQGVEASAATAVVGAGGGPPPSTPFIVRADHPFFFAIRLEPSNEILFMGRLAAPAPPLPVVAENAGARRGRGEQGERGNRGVRGRGQSTVPVSFKDPLAVARSTLELVNATRLDSELVGPQNHPGLWQLLGQLELAANAVIAEDRNNEAAYSLAMTRLANGIAQGITLTGSIASRGIESPATREKSSRLQAKFREIESQ